METSQQQIVFGKVVLRILDLLIIRFFVFPTKFTKMHWLRFQTPTTSNRKKRYFRQIFRFTLGTSTFLMPLLDFRTHWAYWGLLGQ